MNSGKSIQNKFVSFLVLNSIRIDDFIIINLRFYLELTISYKTMSNPLSLSLSLLTLKMSSFFMYRLRLVKEFTSNIT